MATCNNNCSDLLKSRQSCHQITLEIDTLKKQNVGKGFFFVVLTHKAPPAVVVAPSPIITAPSQGTSMVEGTADVLKGCFLRVIIV